MDCRQSLQSRLSQNQLPSNMSSRLNQDREQRLQPERLRTCKEKLEDMGFIVDQIDHTLLQFKLNGNIIKFYPYSGWHSGKGVKDGRGFANLLKQLEEKK